MRLGNARVKTRRILRRAISACEPLEARRLLSVVGPSVESINRDAPAGPGTGASSVAYTVTFNKPVAGVDAADFSVVTRDNVAAASLVDVSGSGAVYTVTINGIHGSGSIGLNLVDNGSIVDLSGRRLEPKAQVAFAAQQSVAAGSAPSSVAAADLNVDGKLDLVVSNRGNDNVSVMLGNGDGTFAAQQTFAVGATPSSVAVSDVNRDGKPDLVVNNPNDQNVGVLLGNGDGTFGSQQAFSIGTTSASVSVADVNGDAKPDLVTANGYDASVSVLLGNGDGTFQAHQDFAAGAGAYSAAVADVNGDGRPDVVTANYYDGTLSVLLGNGDGTFQAQQTVSAAYPISVAVADIDGDGKADLAVANFYSGTVSVHLGNGDGTFQVEQTFAAGDYSGSVAVADVNGDGRADLIATSPGYDTVNVLLGNGDGTFQDEQALATGYSPSSVAVADVNGDGGNDLIVANSGGGDVNVLLNAGGGRPTGSFEAPQTFFAGIAPFSAVSADVNGDGKVDVLTSHYSDGTVGVLLGNGDGTLQVQQSVFVGITPTCVAVADVNGDGKADMAVANYGGGNVSVLLGNGDGSFQTQQTFAAGSGSGFVSVADVNRDGRLDLITANYPGGNVSVLLGNGDGTFQAPLSFAAGFNPRSLEIADVNRDGKADLLVANTGSDNVSVLLGNGDGTFQAQQVFAVGTSPTIIATADFNRDGRTDLAVVNSGDDNVGVLLGNGDGTFAIQQTFAAGFFPRSVAAADVNRDGKPDLTIVNVFGAGVLLGNGDGTFQAVPSFGGGFNSNSVAVADMDGNGRPDLVTANTGDSNIGIFLAASPSGSFTGQTYDVLQTFPHVVSIDRSNPTSSSTSATSVSYTVTFSAPVTGVNAGDFQVLTSGSVVATSSVVVSGSGATYTVAINGIQGSGSIGLNLVDDGSINDLVGNPLQSADASFTTQQTFVAGTRPFSIAMADLDGDGDADLAVANLQSSSARVLLGNGDGTFGAPQSFATGSGPRCIVAADMNGDGKPDLVVGNAGSFTVSILLGNGDGTFQAQQAFATGVSTPNSIAVADVNADGKLDVVVAGGSVSVLLGSGDGTLQSQQAVSAPASAVSVVAGDMDGDGTLDLAVAHAINVYDVVSILVGNGDGTFQSPQTYDIGSSPTSIAAGDFDGDGDLDLTVANAGDQNVGVLLGNGDGTFQSQQTYTATGNSQQIVVADVNGDGKPDLVVADSSYYAAVVRMGNGDGTFGSEQFFVSGQRSISVAVGDVDGDGKADLAVANFFGNDVSIMLGNGVGSFVGQTYNILQTFPHVVSINRASPAGPITSASSVTYTVTFNKAVTGVNAGDFQLVTGGSVTASSPLVSGSGAVYTVTINGIAGIGSLGLNLVDNGSIRDLAGNPLLDDAPATFQSLQTFDVGSSPNSLAEADFNGDGHSDLAVVNEATNNVSILLGNGDGTFQNQQTLAVGSTPVFVATSDFNGDGIADLAVVVSGNDLVRIELGNGDGTFHNSLQFVFVGDAPTCVAVADLNGDGNPDLAVSNYNDNNISVLLGNGDGTFQSQQSFAVGNGPGFVAAADVDGDGNQDLAVVNESDDSVSVLLGNGDGTFQAQQTFAVGSTPRCVAVADFNGDGDLDLAVSNQLSSNVSILLGNGDGTFQSQQTFSAWFGPTSMALSDINADGKADLVIADLYATAVIVLQGNGDGTFQPEQTFTVGGGPFAIAVGDMDEDGKQDVAVANSFDDNVSVLLNNGNGDFTGQAYTFVPIVQSLARTTPVGPNTSAPSVVYTLTFSTSVTGVDASDFSLTLTGTAQTSLPVVVSGSGAVYTITINGITGAGTVGLNLVDDDSITASGVALGGAGAGNGNATGPTYTIFPVVQSLVRTNPAGPTTSVPSVVYTLTFSASVTGVDASDFSFALTGNVTGSTPVVVAGSGAVYTITINGLTGSGTLGLNLVDNDSITGSGVPLGGAGAGNGDATGQVYTVTLFPFVQSFVRTTPSGSETAASSVVYTLTFSAPVTGVDASDFVLGLTGTVQATSPVVVSGSGSVYTITINGISGAGTLGVNLVDDDSINASGFALGGTGAGNGNSTGPVYTIIPIVQSLARTTPAGPDTTATSVVYTLTFSTPVTGVDASDFFVALTGTAQAAAPVVVSGSGAVYTVTINGISGAGTVGLNLVDNDSITSSGVALGGTGSGNGNTTGPLYTIFPVVSSIARATPSGANTAATSVVYTVTFSAPVTGVGASDFALALTGTAQASSPVLVSGSGAVYTVTILDVRGEGSLGLNLVDDDSITSSGAALGGVGAGNGNTTGELYQISPVAIESVSPLTSTVIRGNKLSATCNTITVFPGHKLRSVKFFLDNDHSNSLSKGDKILATDSNPKGGWSGTFEINKKTALGSMAISAVALATNSRNKQTYSPATAGNVTVVDAPPTIKKFSASPSRPSHLKPFTVIAIAADTDGTANQVSFYRDANSNGFLDVGTDILLGTDGNRGDGFKLQIAPGTFNSGASIALFAVATDNDVVQSTPIPLYPFG